MAFWKRALLWSVELIPTESNEMDQVDGLPSKWDRWVFDRITKLILQLNSGPEREAFWKPIMQLPAATHYSG